MPPRKKAASRKPKTPNKKQAPSVPESEPSSPPATTVDQILEQPEQTSSQKSVRKSSRIAKSKSPIKIHPDSPNQPELQSGPEPEIVGDETSELKPDTDIEPEPQFVAGKKQESKPEPETTAEQIPESKPQLESVPEQIPVPVHSYQSVAESGLGTESLQKSASELASMSKEISEVVPEPETVTSSSSATEMVTESVPESAPVAEEIPESVAEPESVAKSASGTEEATKSIGEPNKDNVSNSPNSDTEILETQTNELVTEAPEAAAGKKKVIKVRKVIKKKIVKKLVPKALIAAAKEEAKEIQKVDHQAEKVADMNSNNGAKQVDEDTNLDVKKDAQIAEVESENKYFATDADSENVVVPTEILPKECDPDSKKQCDVGVDESEKKRRKKTEIFIGGLDRNAKEEDLRKVFGKVGEIVEVRMIMDVNSGMNKGFAFIRYADANEAKLALEKFNKVEVCGKFCGASALKGNDTIFLGNIDKKWKKEDIMKLLLNAGIENIEDVNIMPDLHHSGSNRGFALLELQTNKDAHNAYKTLQTKDVFGKVLNVKVAWAQPLDDPDEEELKKVKSVYVEGIPATWNEEEVREQFIKFGEIERIVLARNIDPAKKKDFVFVNYKTRDAALSCIESFSANGLIVDGSKINVKVSLAKPVQKDKQHKGSLKFGGKDKIMEKPKIFRSDSKTSSSSSMGNVWGRGVTGSHNTVLQKPHEYSNARAHVTWASGQTGYAGGPTSYNYPHGGAKRSFSSLGGEHVYPDSRSNPRPRLNMYPTPTPTPTPSYGSMPRGTAGSSYPYYQQPHAGYSTGAQHGAVGYPPPYQMRQGAPMPPPPYGNNYRPRY